MNDRNQVVKAIQMACHICSSGSTKDVKYCQIETCPLHTFRNGKNPHRKGAVQLGEPILNDVVEVNAAAEIAA